MSYFVILHGSFSGAVSLGVFDPGLQFWIKRKSGALWSGLLVRVAKTQNDMVLWMEEILHHLGWLKL